MTKNFNNIFFQHTGLILPKFKLLLTRIMIQSIWLTGIKIIGTPEMTMSWVEFRMVVQQEIRRLVI